MLVTPGDVASLTPLATYIGNQFAARLWRKGLSRGHSTTESTLCGGCQLTGRTLVAPDELILSGWHAMCGYAFPLNAA